MVVDCGSSRRGPHDWDAAQVAHYIAPILAGRSLTVVISHGDADHSNYLPTLFPNGAGVDAVYYGDNFNAYGAATRAWMSAVAAAGHPVYGGAHIAPGPGPMCGAAPTTILAVNTVPGNKNASSLVLGLAYGGHRAILPGDATGATEAAVIHNFGPALHVAMLEASHHGADSQGSNSRAWADATTPSNLVISAGPVGHYGHPRCVAIGHYEAHLAHVPAHYETCAISKQSSTTIHTDRSIRNTEDDGLVTFTIPSAPFAAVQVHTSRP